MGKQVIVLIVVSILVSAGLGVLIGYFAREATIPKSGNDAQSGLKEDCGTDIDPDDNPVVKRYMEKCQSRACETVTCDLPYRVNYMAYHLGDDKITVDGNIAEEAWQKLAWTRRFINIEGPDGDSPFYDAYAKMRWDNDFLYIAAYFQEEHVWANKTDHDSLVWHDNAFEVFVDADGSNHGYKEFQINALETTWDLMMTKPYINGGGNISAWEMPEMKAAVYVDGTVNDPSDTDRYWSIELALPFSNLVENTTRKFPPKDKEIWRINLSRVQYEVKVENGGYHKISGKEAHFWVWSPQYAVAMHLPERYGIVEFSTASVNSTQHSRHPNWSAYSALVDTYYSLKGYQAINGPLTNNVSRLDVPPYVQTDTCVNKPAININGNSFIITAKPKDNQFPTGKMRDDRLIWYE